jgi:hypothetical protein
MALLGGGRQHLAILASRVTFWKISKAENRLRQNNFSALAAR